MASQNINQYVKPNLYPLFSLESYDMSLTSDERDFNQEVVFSPYLIAQTYGNRLPFYFDINSTNSAQNLTLNYKEYNRNNIFVSENYYNPDNIDFSCVTSGTSCDIGLTGIDNGLVTGMTAETITFTNGLLPNNLKFDNNTTYTEIDCLNAKGKQVSFILFDDIPDCMIMSDNINAIRFTK